MRPCWRGGRVRLLAWCVLFVNYRNHSSKMHPFCARGMGQTDRQTDTTFAQIRSLRWRGAIINADGDDCVRSFVDWMRRWGCPVVARGRRHCPDWTADPFRRASTWSSLIAAGAWFIRRVSRRHLVDHVNGRRKLPAATDTSLTDQWPPRAAVQREDTDTLQRCPRRTGLGTCSPHSPGGVPEIGKDPESLRGKGRGLDM